MITPAQLAAILDSAESVESFLQALGSALCAELAAAPSPRADSARTALRLLERLLAQRFSRTPGLTATAAPAPAPEADTFAALIAHLLAPASAFACPAGAPASPASSNAPAPLDAIFAQLAAARRTSGAYYTPRPIAAFMCREALKNYLGSGASINASIGTPIGTSIAPAIEAFVDDLDASALPDPPAVLARLQAVRVCDPACGSGALLVAMLRELMALLQSLHQTHGLGPADPRQRALAVIRHNLFGVDLDPLAVQIARLRLWLTLPAAGAAPPIPLADLGANLTHGDSLLGPDPASSPAFDVLLANPPYVRQELITPHKPALRLRYPEVYDGRADLLCYFYARALELLAPGGVMAFISSNKWLRANYGRPLRRLLAASLHFSHIIDFGELPVFPNAATFPMILIARRPALSSSPSPSPSQSQSQSPSDISHSTIPHSVTLPLAEADEGVRAPSYSAICNPQSAFLFTRVPSLAPPYPDLKSLVARHGRPLPAGAIQGADWQLASPRALTVISCMSRAGRTLKDYTGGRIDAGIKTGLNQAFWLSDAQARALLARDPASAQLLRPLLRGDAIRKWTLAAGRQWLIYTPPGTDLAPFAAIREHLAPFRERLERRALNQRWFELQQAQARYARDFPRPKIVYPDIAREPRFTLDTTGAFIDMTAFALPTDDLFLLAVLNSVWAWRFLAGKAAVLGDARAGGRLRLKRQYMGSLPIPAAPAPEEARIAALAERCLAAHGQACADAERELDERLAALYGLSACMGRLKPGREAR